MLDWRWQQTRVTVRTARSSTQVMLPFQIIGEYKTNMGAGRIEQERNKRQAVLAGARIPASTAIWDPVTNFAFSSLFFFRRAHALSINPPTLHQCKHTHEICISSFVKTSERRNAEEMRSWSCLASASSLAVLGIIGTTWDDDARTTSDDDRTKTSDDHLFECEKTD